MKTHSTLNVLKSKRQNRISGLFRRSGLALFLLSITFLVWECKKDDFKPTTGVCPVVVFTDPANGDSNVVLSKTITATFNVVMNPATINNSTFLLRTGSTQLTGAVSINGADATFDPTVNLIANTTYTATITMGAKDHDKNSMIADYVWTFKTGDVVNGTPPTVISTDPFNTETNVALNRNVMANFSTVMLISSINATNFRLNQGANSISGVVTYSGITATFNPDNDLLPNTLYTATIKGLPNGVEDNAGTNMVADYVWTFTTGTALDNIRPTVILTDPLDLATAVPTTKVITATFSEAMNSSTVNGSSFLLKEGTNSVSGVVAFVSGNTYSFTPAADLLPSTLYTATITNTVADVVGNTMLLDYVWTFTTAGPVGPMAIDLDCAAQFAVLAGSTVTNTGNTIVDGDLGLSPGTAVTGFPPGVVTGSIRVNDAAANDAKLCLTAAYIDGMGRSQDVIVVSDGELGGKTFAPGLYKSAPGSFGITNSDMTLDAGGNVNAVWIFQMPSSTFTVGNGRKMILAGGANPDNIFFIVGSSATIGTTAEMYGNILADQSITLNTGASLTGRALTRIAAVSLDFNAVTLP